VDVCVDGAVRGGTVTTDRECHPIAPLHAGRGVADSGVTAPCFGVVSTTYPRDQFVVEPAQRDEIRLGVGVSGDGNADEEFDADAISGVNNNEFSFTTELDTGHMMITDDTVLVGYPAVDNPAEPVEYEVAVSVNEVRTATATVTIEKLSRVPLPAVETAHYDPGSSLEHRPGGTATSHSSVSSSIISPSPTSSCWRSVCRWSSASSRSFFAVTRSTSPASSVSAISSRRSIRV
jgi:hypothetical protein